MPAQNPLSFLAAQGAAAENRVYEEVPHALRTPFQRDRDRVIHSKAFRRLEYKTQVFVNHWGDNFRTRLTHSIEVAQVARTVARSLGLSEDLTETVALAHDLGHPPFGHAGERALHDKMKEYGGFDHNEQTLRVLTLLEEHYPQFNGLNLTRATLRSLQKHASQPAGFADETTAESKQGHFLEALLVDICDEIAYNSHDIDDGIESGYLSLSQLEKNALWKEYFQRTEKRYVNSSQKILVRSTIRALINGMVSDLIEHSRGTLESAGLNNLSELLDYTGDLNKPPLIAYSSGMEERVKELKIFLFHNLYRHAEVVKMNERAAHIVSRIFDFVSQEPRMLPEEYFARIDIFGKERVVADFIAGMTDRYAMRWNNEILGS